MFKRRETGIRDTFFYTKLFLLMVIPFFGFLFCFLLSFSKEADYELKSIARGALIARIIFDVVLLVGGVILIDYVFPYLQMLISNINLAPFMQLFKFI